MRRSHDHACGLGVDTRSAALSANPADQPAMVALSAAEEPESGDR